jgi:hypothetical protein
LASIEFVASLRNGHSGFEDSWLNEHYGRPLGFYVRPMPTRLSSLGCYQFYQFLATPGSSRLGPYQPCQGQGLKPLGECRSTRY